MRGRLNSTFAVLPILALGIGVCGAFTSALLVRFNDPIPGVFRSEELVAVPQITDYVRYGALASTTKTLDLAAYTWLPQPLRADTATIRIGLSCVTDTYFSILGVRPSTGSLVLDANAPEPTVILSSDLWSSLFNRDLSAIGRTVTIAGRRHTVIGVADPSFAGLDDRAAEAWILFAREPEICSSTSENLLYTSSASWLRTVARVRDADSFSAAEAEIRTIQSALSLSPSGGKSLLPLVDMRAAQLAGQKRLGTWIALAALIVLLASSINVSLVALIRGVGRRLEYGIRRQLGASRKSIFGQIVLEHLTLGAVAAVGSIPVYLIASRRLETLLPNGTTPIDTASAVGIVTATAVVATTLSCLGPLLQTNRFLAGFDRGCKPSAQAVGRRLTSSCVVIQILFGFTLTLSGEVFRRSIDTAKAEAGYDLENVIALTFDAPLTSRMTEEEAVAMIEALTARLSDVPGLHMVSASSGGLLGSGGRSMVTSLRLPSGKTSDQTVTVRAITDDYFNTVGTRLVEGLPFTSAVTSRSTSEPVVILDKNAANRLGLTNSPIGECVYLRGVCHRIVGISEPRRSHAIIVNGGEVFIPLRQASAELVPRRLEIRAADDVQSILPGILERIRGMVPGIAITVTRLEDLADAQLQSWQVATSVFLTLALLVSIVTTTGLIAVLQYWVRQQHKELAVRMALGAHWRRLATTVLARAVSLGIIGSIMGIAVGFVILQYLRSIIADTIRFAPHLIVLLPVGVVLVICVIASLPSIVAVLRLSPANVLKGE